MKISDAMFLAVAEKVAELEDTVDVHTITLVLNGQHGEFDLEVQGNEDDDSPWLGEDVCWSGIAHRMGGVSDWVRSE